MMLRSRRPSCGVCGCRRFAKWRLDMYAGERWSRAAVDDKAAVVGGAATLCKQRLGSMAERSRMSRSWETREKAR
jgi:hypothetical protein